MKTLYSPFVYATLAEIGQSDVAAVGGIGKVAFEMIHGEIIRFHHSLSLIHLAAFLVGNLMLLNLNVIFFCKVAQRLPIRELLMLHHKIYRAATFTATETFADSFGSRHRERRCALIVKRAQADVVGTSTAEMHEIAHHLHNVGGVENFLNCFPVDCFHLRCYVNATWQAETA